MRNVSIGLLMFVAIAVAQPPLPRPAPAMNLLQPCKGKVTLLAFINTSCPHCKRFSGSVMQPLYAAGQVCAIAIAFDENADTATFAREQRLTFPVYRISRAQAAGFLGEKADKIIGTPQVVVIDKHGMIQAQSEQEGSALLLQAAVVRELVERLR